MAVSKLALTNALRTTRTVSYRQPSQHLYRPIVLQRHFHLSRRQDIVKPFLLADIGEGITECQLIQWFVQPGARVEQFDKLCEVQSDKASVEISSPFDGVIKKLYYEPDDIAVTGKPLVDIDIQGEISEADEAKLAGGEEEGGAEEGEQGKSDVEEREREREREQEVAAEGGADLEMTPKNTGDASAAPKERSQPALKNDQRSLATPAVRHLTKEHNVDIADIEGTGKDGRVLKEDVHRHVSSQGSRGSKEEQPAQQQPTPTSREDRKAPLSPVQSQMFKTMTRSLQIPHFLYSCSLDISAITTLRKTLNKNAASKEDRLTHLPFVMKAVSLAFQHHPLLNASLDTKDPKKPELTYKGSHNFGVAIDTPSGLLVPVVRNVQDLSIFEIAAKLRELSTKARENKLSPGDFLGATFTVSNIGNIGGGVVAPVISEPQVAILGVGRSRLVPAFDENEELVKREELVLSWSADHRVVDGAECARCAERVKGLLEEPGRMLVGLR